MTGVDWDPTTAGSRVKWEAGNGFAAFGCGSQSVGDDGSYFPVYVRSLYIVAEEDGSCIKPE
jgi:hypothetical protein